MSARLLQPKEEGKMAATMQPRKEKKTSVLLQPKEEEEVGKMAATMQPKKEKKKRSAPLQPEEEEEEMAATMRPKKEKRTSAPLRPKEEEKKASATCRRTLMNKDRTLAEVTFADAHRISATVTHSNAVVAGWIDETVHGSGRRYGGVGPRRRRVVGLEVSCRRNGYIALLQLCVGNRCLIYQPLHSDSDSDSDDDHYPAGELFAFLNDDRFCFVAAGAEEVVYGLERYHRLAVRNAADLGHMAARWLHRDDLRRAGLEELAREVMGVEMDTPAEVRMNERWPRHLSRQQIAYACVDAFVSFKLGTILYGR